MKSRKEQDFELVKAAQAGDTRAFDQLIRRYRTSLTRYLSIYIRESGEAEDVVQDTFIKAFMALDRFRGESSFATWLFHIGINTAKHSYVRTRRRLSHQVEPAPATAGSQQHSGIQTGMQTDYDTPEARMESKQILALLDSAIDDLPAEQRTALIMRELEGFSYDEIAEKMHSPVGTVRSRIHRARDTIAAVLKRG